MCARVRTVFIILILSAAYYIPGRGSFSHYPSDLRDAVNSGSAFDKLANSAPAGEAPPPPAPAYERSGGNKSIAAARTGAAGNCGPDITRPLSGFLDRINATYHSWPPSLREENCAALDVSTERAVVTAWDIQDLRPDLGYPSVLSGSLPVAGNCRMTLAVDGKCYRNEEVNYIMWGAMTRLCGKSLAWSKLKIRAYLMYYYKYLARKGDSAFPGEADNKIDWAEAGYYEWPRNYKTPPASRPECAPSRLAPLGYDSAFTAHWGKGDITP